jgi:hypothetical protein
MLPLKALNTKDTEGAKDAKEIEAQKTQWAQKL